MSKYRNRVLRTTNIIIDSGVVAAATVLTFAIRMALTPYINATYEISMMDYLRTLFITIPLWDFLLHVNGLYPTNRLRPFRDVLWIIVKTGVGCAVICIFILYYTKIYILGRVALVVFVFIVSGLLTLKEIVMRGILEHSRAKGHGLRNVLIIGDKALMPKIIKTIEGKPHLGLHLSGAYILDDGNEGSFDGIKTFSPEKDIRLLLLDNHIDNVIIAVGKEKLSETEELLLKCEEFGAEIWLYADFFELMFAQKEIDALDDIPFLVFRTTPKASWPMVFKRLIDFAGAVVLGIICVPIGLFAAAGIKFTSPGPVIFKQKRVGLHGRKFVFYKFRSMTTDAEQRRQELLGRNIMTGPVFKIKNDPRITPFGRFLRRTSIDELPQLWNVLKGDMSLVGPRPPLPREVAEYRGWQRRRLSMRPGLVCLWQVQGRSEITDFDKWAELDLKYIDNWSLWLDLTILLKAVFVVLFRIGAE
ncbi:MAG: sugar transferase [Candidatus Omnitrophota bacterium]